MLFRWAFLIWGFSAQKSQLQLKHSDQFLLLFYWPTLCRVSRAPDYITNVGFLGRWGMTLSLSEAGPGRFGGQASVTDIYHAMPCHLPRTSFSSGRSWWFAVQFVAEVGVCSLEPASIPSTSGHTPCRAFPCPPSCYQQMWFPDADC